MKNFEIEFVKRTKEILMQYDGTRDMSILINCTLGLIILPYEKMRENPPSLWDIELDKISNHPCFKLMFFKPIKGIKKSQVRYYPKTMAVLLRKIRNGLAHQHIEPVNEEGKFAGAIIRNYFEQGDQQKLDLEIHFSQQELKEFALFIANEYLKNRTPEMGS